MQRFRVQLWQRQYEPAVRGHLEARAKVAAVFIERALQPARIR